jgi:phosphoenolpyruvate carboxykinase (ATP)
MFSAGTTPSMEAMSSPTEAKQPENTPHSYAVETIHNPSQDALRTLALEHTPAVHQTAQGNLVKVAKNKARKAQWTYVIAPESDASKYSCKVMDRPLADALIGRQRAYIEEQGTLIAVDGFIGLGPRAVATQWLYTLEGANIAGMQSILSFPVADVLADTETFNPTFRVVYTPGCPATDMPGNQAIIVDLENYTTYILGPDYFGESKKGALRMLNHKVYQEGGLVLHAGAKSVMIDGRTVSMTIMGLSGTGKTTTTFSKQGDLTQPIQDDMVSLWPKGELSITENGCFAKTFGLNEASEPVIYRGTMSSDAWVENVYTDARGAFDFDKGMLSPEEVSRLRDVLLTTGAAAAKVDAYISGAVTADSVTSSTGAIQDGWDFIKWTENGRSIIPMSSIEDAADLHAISAVATMGILNRDEGIDAATPGIVRFSSPAQAAGFFMLGETTKTSAGGKETGKTRSPFTQPFFPLAHGLQAERFSTLAATMVNVDLWMMNTGYVAGDAQSVAKGEGMKVKIRHSSAMLEAMLKDEIVWTTDPDFGYQIVDIEAPQNAALVNAVGTAILNPRSHYAATGKADIYAAWVERMKEERRVFLTRFSVDPGIIEATINGPDRNQSGGTEV